MKHIIYFLFVSFLFTAACSGEADNDSDSAQVELSEEMEEFTETASDTTQNLQDIIKKFAEDEKLKKHDIINRNLSEVKVVEKKGDCYTIETPDAGLTRVYEICWEDEKITTITDKGIK